MVDGVGKAGRFPQLGKYGLLEQIGHGGMATVYRARDRRLGREVAVKVIHPHLRDSPEVASRFQTEAKAVAKLHHPNIVEVYDVSEADEPEQYLVAELVRGTTLRKLQQQRGAMPPEIAAAVALEVLAAKGPSAARAGALSLTGLSRTSPTIAFRMRTPCGQPSWSSSTGSALDRLNVSSRRGWTVPPSTKPASPSESLSNCACEATKRASVATPCLRRRTTTERSRNRLTIHACCSSSRECIERGRVHMRRGSLLSLSRCSWPSGLLRSVWGDWCDCVRHVTRALRPARLTGPELSQLRLVRRSRVRHRLSRHGSPFRWTRRQGCLRYARDRSHPRN